MKVRLKTINAPKESVLSRLTDILGKEPMLDHDTFIFEVTSPFMWDKVKTMVNQFSTMHETIIIMPA